jgi:hypothetical protein
MGCLFGILPYGAGVLLSLDSLGDILYDGHMERFTYLKNALLRRRSVVHLRGGHRAIDRKG